MQITIEKIDLQYFCRHQDESIEIPSNGLTLIWGPSGGGKSSITEAVAYALFGYRATRAKSTSDLINDGWADQQMGVRVTFSLGGEGTIQVYRGLDERGDSTCWIVDTDGELVEGAEAVKARISEITGGMDGPTFYATYFSRQRELEALVTMKGGDLRKFIMRICGVSALDKVIHRAGQVATAAEGSRDQVTALLPVETAEQLTTARDGALDRAGRTAAEAASAAAEAEASAALSERLTATFETLDQLMRRKSTLAPRVAALADQEVPAAEERATAAGLLAKESDEALARVKEHGDIRVRLQALRDEQAKLDEAASAIGAIERLQREASEAANLLHEREQELTTATAARERLGAQIDPAELAAQRERLLGDYRSRDERLKEAQGRLESLRRDGTCYVCLRPLQDGGGHALIHLEDEIAALQVQIETIRSEGVGIKERLDLATEAANAAASAQRALERAAALHEQAAQTTERGNARLAEAEREAQVGDPARLAAVREELAGLSEVAAKLATDESTAAKAPALRESAQRTTRQLADLRERLVADRSELEGLDVDEESYAATKTQLEAERARHADLRELAARLQGEAQLAEREAAESDQKLERLRQTSEQRDRLVEKANLYRNLSSVLRDFKTDLIGSIRPELEARSSEILRTLSNGDMPGIIIDDQYEMTVKVDERKRAVRLLSGGEQARVAFSLRLALTQLVSQRTDTPVGFLVFDEIMGSQDEDNRHGILEALASLRNVLPQVILISHESSIRDSEMVDCVVEVPKEDAPQRVLVSSR